MDARPNSWVDLMDGLSSRTLGLVFYKLRLLALLKMRGALSGACGKHAAVQMIGPSLRQAILMTMSLIPLGR